MWRNYLYLHGSQNQFISQMNILEYIVLLSTFWVIIAIQFPSVNTATSTKMKWQLLKRIVS